MSTRSKIIDLRPGTALPKLEPEDVSRERILAYAGASGDYNPMHVDEVMNVDAGMGGVFAHGMLGTGFLGRVVTDHLGDVPLSSLSVRCLEIVRPGDVLTATGTVDEKKVVGGELYVSFELQAVNQRDEVTHLGSATIRVPVMELGPEHARRDVDHPLVTWRAIG